VLSLHRGDIEGFEAGVCGLDETRDGSSGTLREFVETLIRPIGAQEGRSLADAQGGEVRRVDPGNIVRVVAVFREVEVRRGGG
jgi:hypothetical protein